MKKTRRYQSPVRDRQAAQTKARILKKAKDLFVLRGFNKVTIGQIAKESEVSMPTIYTAFHSKKGVLEALIDDSLSRKEFITDIDLSLKETSAKKHLQETAKIARKAYDAEREIIDIVRHAAGFDPAVKNIEKQREERRGNRQQLSIQAIKDCNDRNKTISLEKAYDIMWTLTNRGLYNSLVIDRGWSSNDYEKWLAKNLIENLCN